MEYGMNKGVGAFIHPRLVPQPQPDIYVRLRRPCGMDHNALGYDGAPRLIAVVSC